MNHRVETDVLIAGGTTGGVGAALALASRGVRCVVAESTDWIGGQLTAQGVPADEHRWIEDGIGATRRYLEFRSGVRDWYRTNRALTPESNTDPRLNPGNGWVSRLCCEPSVAHTVLRDMLEPYVKSGLVTILPEHELVGAEADADRVRSVELRSRDGASVSVSARYFLESTDAGELLDLAKIEHRIGAEARARHNEMNAPDNDDSLDQQALSWCFALEHRPGEDHTIDRPARYAFWRSYVPEMRDDEPPWTGPLFSWTIPTHNEEGRRELPLVPPPDEPAPGQLELWRYRRIADPSLYERDAPPDTTLVNWVQMDYWLEPLLGVEADARARTLEGARELSRCLLYWMQTEAPRHDGGTGYPGLKLAQGVLGTDDGFAKSPYIREPRRLEARTMLTEAHVGTEQRRAEKRAGMDPTDENPYGRGEAFIDSVAIGHYPIDLHPSCSGRNSVYIPACPFRVPLGSLVPVRARNVIGAGKAIGVTHIANGCTRLHPVEWNVGESGGALAAFCIANELEPAQVHGSPDLIREFQNDLVRDGVQIAWPWEK